METKTDMDGEKRRAEIIRILEEKQNEGIPIAGTELAKQLGVSRQVIVQDIALLRAVNKNILSTNKGYLLFQEKEAAKACKRFFKVKHTAEGMQQELYAIVDHGGRLLDVEVDHPIYGQIMADLIIHNRQDVDNFVREVKVFGTKPLSSLTDDIHYHTVEADSEAILDGIEVVLKRLGYLMS